MANKDWWKRFFTVSTYPLAELTKGRHAEAEVRELLRRLPVKKGAAILDVGCGLGRHSFPLSTRGYQVTGIDYSASYLSQARKRANGRRRAPRFLRRDMRALGFRGEFDVAINLWTSFGYFPRYSDDLRTLRSIRQALRPRGWLAMELVEGGRFLRDGITAKDWGHVGRFWGLEANRLRRGGDPAMTTERIFIDDRGRVTGGETFVRLYDRRRLKRALTRAGFRRTFFSDGLLGGPNASNRLFALARRD